MRHDLIRLILPCLILGCGNIDDADAIDTSEQGACAACGPINPEKIVPPVPLVLSTGVFQEVMTEYSACLVANGKMGLNWDAEAAKGDASLQTLVSLVNNKFLGYPGWLSGASSIIYNTDSGSDTSSVVMGPLSGVVCFGTKGWNELTDPKADPKFDSSKLETVTSGAITCAWPKDMTKCWLGQPAKNFSGGVKMFANNLNSAYAGWVTKRDAECKKK